MLLDIESYFFSSTLYHIDIDHSLFITIYILYINLFSISFQLPTRLPCEDESASGGVPPPQPMPMAPQPMPMAPQPMPMNVPTQDYSGSAQWAAAK